MYFYFQFSFYFYFLLFSFGFGMKEKDTQQRTAQPNNSSMQKSNETSKVLYA